MKVSTLFTGLILLFLLILLVISLDYPGDLKLLPWIFISLAIILGVVQILRETSARGKGEEKNELKLGEWVGRIKGVDRGYLTAILWILGLLLSLYLLGFVVVIPIFTILYLKTHGESWWFSITLSAIGWGFLFAVFAFGLKMSFYEGLLFVLLFS